MAGPPGAAASPGYTKQTFAQAVLQGIGAPITKQNLQAMIGWENAEGGHWSNSATYNPLNTTQNAPGANSMNGVGVKAYTSWGQGLAATIQTLKNGYYGSILSALKAGNNPGAVASAIGASPWGTSGSLVSQTINAAGGQVGPIAAIAQSKAGIGPTKKTAAGIPKPAITNPTTGSAGQPDNVAAGVAALMAGADKPIDQSGKVSVDNSLSRMLANISSGLYNTPASPTASTSPAAPTGSPAAKAIAQGKSAPPLPTGQYYTNPIKGAVMGRTDMGLDASGLANGHPIVAIGNSRVAGISPNWYAGQPYVLFQLLDGPDKGKYYYIAEAINPTVHTGQVVRAGQTVGTYNSGGTGLELGWGSPTPGRTMAQATTGYYEGEVTPSGVAFKNFFGGLK